MSETTNSSKMDAIESKEIRGMSLRALITIIISTISIVSSVVMTYSSIISKIDKFTIQKDGDDRFNNQRFSTIESRVTSLESDIKELREYHEVHDKK